MEILQNSSYPTEQVAFAERVNQLLKDKLDHRPKACVVTYGCQQNVSDSERLKGMLCLCGYEMTEQTDEADLILSNTCAVRGHAEDRVYGNVGALKHLKRRNPNLIIGVCGCMAQQQIVVDRFKKSFRYVDMVFGTQVQHRLPEMIYRVLQGEHVYETSLPNDSIVEDVPVRRDGDVKGWLPIMNGCNNFCTYCIVPYVRGRERSREPEAVLQEAREMIAAGYKEIMLLGQNVNSYGKGEAHGVNFSKLLRQINAIEGDFRIRFMTSHPKDCTTELLDAMRDCEKVAKHLHLPFQSGSDRILKQMNRHYDRAGYLNLIKEARERMPQLAITSDIIVGFPGETYEDFCETLSLVRSVEFTSLFTFIFSPREGTPAARMDDPVSRAEKGKWFNELLKTQETVTSKTLQAAVGSTQRVLVEGCADTSGFLVGHTDGNLSVEFAADESLLNQLCTVKITSYDGILRGEYISK